MIKNEPFPYLFSFLEELIFVRDVSTARMERTSAGENVCSASRSNHVYIVSIVAQKVAESEKETR